MLISTEEAANRLGINRRTVLLWIKTQRLPAYRLSRCWKIDSDQLEQWIESKRVNVPRR
ncbi:helix-turn-helix domain-containing protein [uncultured Sphaerochaeta sp.]|jgi:excisionase family DNA binding protein|uniref:helix-turn-helix domain-containing protein n=1 Tax=Sphaerochaeta sp. TaxID=1972642 RepID=UPI002AA8A75D|nr:helix-turn-helix domain-containing protein [uncultured Sphaerochaeta sp.]